MIQYYSTMLGNESDAPCPFSPVDQRLDDVHRLWHGAEKGYFIPNEFRINMQNAIQSLRSVTFILQKNKHLIPNFDSWYEPWQVRMKRDPLMRWLVDSRNKIEKEGDLASKSYVRAEIIASYLENGPRLDVEADLFQGPKELFTGIHPAILHQQIFKHGTLRIERRWIQNELPEFELLEAIASAYGFISDLLDDAHGQLGLKHPTVLNCGPGIKLSSPELRGRLPCMVGLNEPRVRLISLATGQELQFEDSSATITPEHYSAASTRYDVESHFQKFPAAQFQSVQDLGRWFFNLASVMFLKDGYHLPFMFFLKGPKIIKFVGVDQQNRQQKYLMMRRLAEEAVKCGADGAMLITETWIASPESLGAFEFPSEAKDRKEALCLQIVTKSGVSLSLSAMIKRNNDLIELEATQVDEGGVPFNFAPFLEAWGRPIDA